MLGVFPLSGRLHSKGSLPPLTDFSLRPFFLFQQLRRLSQGLKDCTRSSSSHRLPHKCCSLLFIIVHKINWIRGTWLSVAASHWTQKKTRMVSSQNWIVRESQKLCCCFFFFFFFSLIFFFFVPTPSEGGDRGGQNKYKC